MIIAKVQVSGIRALTECRKVIPAGLIGGRIEFDFVDSRWDNLTKTIVFQGCETRDVLLDGNTAIIPQEVVARPGALLLVGVYGTDAKNALALPTMWAVIGEVRPAADPSSDPAADSTLPIWAQLVGRVEELEKNPPTGDGSGKNGEDGFSPIATVEQTEAGAVVSITDANGTTTATITNGKSAYDYAKDGGYAGTEDEFKAKLATEYPVPDWAASPGQPGHIHNRTHKAVTAELDPVFNGNVYDYPNIGNENFALCQVSYDYCGIENLLGATLVIDTAGTEQTHIISQENITNRMADGYPVLEIHLDGIEPPVVVSVHRDVLFKDDTGTLAGFYLSPGVHFLCIPDTVYAKSLSCLGHSERTYYDTLHPKFLPDRRHYGELVVRAFDEEQTVVDEETGESKTVHKTYFDHDFFDIDEAYKEGKFIRLLGVHGDLLPMVSAVPGELYTFIGFDGGAPTSATFGLKAAAV